MRILHLLSQRPDLTGSGVYLQAMLRHAADAGHVNWALVGMPADVPVQLAGVAPEAVVCKRFGTAPSRAIVGMSDVMPYPSRRFRDLSAGEIEGYEAQFTQLLDHTLVDAQPDLLHSHHLWLLSAAARRLVRDRPIVVSCHGSDLRQLQALPELAARIRPDLARIDRVLALHPDQVPQIQKLCGVAPERIVVTGAGYDADLFTWAASSVEGPVRLLYAGKLSRSKGVPWLLRALAGLEDRDWRLELVGDGSGRERDEVQALATALEERVRLPGALPQPELAARMRAAHAFVLPSLYEGLPLVLIEALASGCRLLSTRVPGAVQLLDQSPPGVWYPVPLPPLQGVDELAASDEAGFVQALQKALGALLETLRTTPPLQQPEVAALLQRYRWAGVFERVARVYAELCGTG